MVVEPSGFATVIVTVLPLRAGMIDPETVTELPVSTAVEESCIDS